MLIPCSHFLAQGVKRPRAQQPNLKLAKMSIDFSNTIVQINTCYNNIMETNCKNGEQKYTDLSDWLTTLYPMTAPEKLIAFAHKFAQNITITHTYLQSTEHTDYRNTYTSTHTAAHIDLHRGCTQLHPRAHVCEYVHRSVYACVCM